MENEKKSFQDMIKEGKERMAKLLETVEDQGEKLKEPFITLNEISDKSKIDN